MLQPSSAWPRSAALGRRDEATVAFQRFETLNQEKVGSPLAHTYGDEGQYSLVEDALMLNPRSVP